MIKLLTLLLVATACFCKEDGKRVVRQAGVVDPSGQCAAPYQAHPTDYSKYFTCSNGVVTQMTCSPGTLWHPLKMTCDFKDNVLAYYASMQASPTDVALGKGGPSPPILPGAPISNIDVQTLKAILMKILGFPPAIAVPLPAPWYPIPGPSGPSQSYPSGPFGGQGVGKAIDISQLPSPLPGFPSQPPTGPAVQPPSFTGPQPLAPGQYPQGQLPTFGGPGQIPKYGQISYPSGGLISPPYNPSAGGNFFPTSANLGQPSSQPIVLPPGSQQLSASDLLSILNSRR